MEALATPVAPKKRMAAVELTGRQKVAILLMTVGKDAAAEISKELKADELEEISLEIARMETVAPEVAMSVLDEWYQTERAAAKLAEGGVSYAKEILESTLGQDKAASVLRRIEAQLRDVSGLYNLREVDPQQLTTVLRPEHPQTIGLILAHLDADQTAGVIRELDAEVGADVLYRMARMEKVLPEVLEVVRMSLGSAGELSLSQQLSSAGGPQTVGEVLNRIGGALEKDLLNGIAAKDPDLSEEIKNLMFVFEDILRLDARALQRLLRDIEAKTLAVALKAATEELRNKIKGTMTKRAVESLEEEMEFLGPVRLSDVEDAQGEIVRAARALEEAGEIVIATGGDDVFIE